MFLIAAKKFYVFYEQCKRIHEKSYILADLLKNIILGENEYKLALEKNKNTLLSNLLLWMEQRFSVIIVIIIAIHTTYLRSCLSSEATL